MKNQFISLKGKFKNWNHQTFKYTNWRVIISLFEHKSLPPGYMILVCIVMRWMVENTQKRQKWRIIRLLPILIDAECHLTALDIHRKKWLKNSFFFLISIGEDDVFFHRYRQQIRGNVCFFFKYKMLTNSCSPIYM